MGEQKWYVLRVISGQEKKIKTYLENEIARNKLEDYIPQVLIPSEKVYEMRNGKKRVRERNCFRRCATVWLQNCITRPLRTKRPARRRVTTKAR